MFRNLYNNTRVFLTLLNRKQIFYIVFLQIFMILAGILEIAAIASVLPFISLISDPNIVNNENYYYIPLILSSFNIDNANAINFFGFIFIAFFIFSNLFIGLTQSLIIFATNRVEKIIINKLFSNYLFEKYIFHVEKNSALLIKNIEKEVNRFADAVFNQFLDIISKGIITVFIVIGLILVDTKSALMIMGLFSILYLILILLIKTIFLVYGKIISDSYNYRIKLINESFRGIKLLKFYKIEIFFLNIFKNFNLKLYNTLLKYRIISIWPKYFIETILVISIISVVLYNINYNPNYIALIPTATFFLLAGYRLLPMLQTIFNNFGSIRVNIAAWNAIRDDLNKNSKISDKQHQNNITLKFKNNINMQNITFAYKKNSYVLHDVNIKIEKQKITGITGTSGSGKTTLMDILSGLLELQKGKILIDESELDSNQLTILQSVIGYVPQETYLMDDSITNNIVLNQNININHKKIESICKKLNLNDFISSLPQKYEYNVGENASRFSGGQKQRLGIARALYRDSQILIFDEPTSSLDQENEDIFIDLIKSLSRDVTIIIISHSMSLKKAFDKTYLLDNGKLLEI